MKILYSGILFCFYLFFLVPPVLADDSVPTSAFDDPRASQLEGRADSADSAIDSASTVADYNFSEIQDIWDYLDGMANVVAPDFHQSVSDRNTDSSGYPSAPSYSQLKSELDAACGQSEGYVLSEVIDDDVSYSTNQECSTTTTCTGGGNYCVCGPTICDSWCCDQNTVTTCSTTYKTDRELTGVCTYNF